MIDFYRYGQYQPQDKNHNTLFLYESIASHGFPYVIHLNAH